MKLSTSFATFFLFFFAAILFSALGEQYICDGDHSCGGGLLIILLPLAMYAFFVSQEQAEKSSQIEGREK